METPPERQGTNLDAYFLQPDEAPGSSAPVPLVPPNARVRARRGYVPDPVEESVPQPSQDPRVTYLRRRSVETGEVQFPLDEVITSSSMVPSHALPEWLGAEALQKYEERVRAREGSRLVRQLWFWATIAACLLFGALISALLRGGLGGVGYNSTSVILLLAGASMGTFFARVSAYGWLPLCRKIFLSTSRDVDVVQWRKGYGAAERLELQRRVDKR